MKFHITVTEEDYIAFNLDCIRHYPNAKKNMLIGRLTGLFLSAFVMLLLLALRASEIVLLIGGIILAYFSAVSFFRYPSQYEKSVRRSIQRISKEGKPPYEPEADIEFTDTEMIQTTEKSMRRVAYGDLIRIVETPYRMYLYDSPSRAYILPLRCLGDEKDALLELLKEKCPPANAAALSQ